MTQVPPPPPPPPSGQQQQYAQPGGVGRPMQEAPEATAGLVFGILSIVLNIPILGLIFAWIGFSKSKSAKDLCAAYPGMYSNGGVATAGYVCSIIGLVLGALMTLGCCAYVGFFGLLIVGGAAGAAGG